MRTIDANNCFIFGSIPPRHSTDKMADDVYACAYAYSNAISLDIRIRTNTKETKISTYSFVVDVLTVVQYLCLFQLMLCSENHALILA